MTSLNTTLENSVVREWVPVETSSSEMLAKEIMSEGFQDSLTGMLDAFDKLVPKEEDLTGRKFISMAQKNKLIEDFFPFGELVFRSQFLSLEDGQEVCYMTLYVLTDGGYEPWFSRLGMANATKSSDGSIADAETSAKRRLMIALGLGYEGNTEHSELNIDKTVKALEEAVISNGTSLFQIVSEYQKGAHLYNLPSLSGEFPETKAQAQSKGFGVKDINCDDGFLLLTYLKERQEQQDEE